MKLSKLIKASKVIAGDVGGLVRREIDFYKCKPTSGTLFLTYRCNSRCKTCTMWKRPHDIEIDKEIGIKDWIAIIDKIEKQGVKAVEIFGGNALLRKELLMDVLKQMGEKGFFIHFPTNQIGLDEDIAEAVVEYVRFVYLSKDGVDKEQDHIRGVEGASELTEQSVRMLRALREKSVNSRLQIICNCTVSRFNYDQLEQIAEYAYENNFDQIHFEYAGEFEKEVLDASIVNGIRPEPYYLKEEQESVLLSKNQAIDVKKRLKAIKKKYENTFLAVSTINIDSFSVNRMHQGRTPHRKCYVERNEITVDPYGNIVACPFVREYSVGNLGSNEFQDIWNNERHLQFRKAQNAGQLPLCNNCILGVQRNPGVWKSLHRIYLGRIQPRLMEI